MICAAIRTNAENSAGSYVKFMAEFAVSRLMSASYCDLIIQ